MSDLAEWLTNVLKEDKARISSPVFCGGPWPSADQMLADIAAKRAILELMEYAYDDPTYLHVVKQLGTAYAARPGYREDWRP